MVFILKVILVTGGAGFVGSHLLEELAQNESYVLYSLDDYSSGVVANHVPRVNYIRGNTRDISELVECSPDTVFHLGEYARVERSFEDVDKVLESNLAGTSEVLKFCRKHGCKLIYAGSSTKFGDGGAGRSQSPYAWSKAANTELVRNFGEWFGLDYAITYFYNVFGGREISAGDYATVIGLFKDAYKAGSALGVVAPGTQKRNFTHVNDIVSGLILVALKGSGDEYGIGAPHSYSILEIAKMFGGEIRMLPERRGNRMQAKLITERTESLGWSATIDVRDHIHEFASSNGEAGVKNV